ncbi:FIVAR domain-containing protein [Anaerococcus degeneri]|uniref:FIVAR domain-containing protein n=1 Tax=Anaerococcus degeneri TaxID=361500 RepID=A0ABS7YY15_9FIRM|nr:FIVAR domain-containing protein [Anaerococcus degeneri]MBP2016174.1 hypothetical protein [Anaerococcus degeneri]MCA2096623.1 FIVAR domain-containing protein [Anaerococcus degeneri]
MNKKIIASLLTLGLVLSPVSGAVSESYATEVSSEKRELSKEELALEKIGIIKNYLNYYQSYKDSNDYRLADDASRAKLDKAAIDAAEYSKKNEVTLAELDKHISSIENALAELVSNASDNQKSLKINIINSNKLLANNDTKKETDEYKLVSAKIANAMAVLKKDNIDKSDFKKLITANSELVDAFLKAKEKFEDKTSYELPKDEEISKLDEELNKEVKVNIDFKKLLEDRQALIEKNESFKTTTEYIEANPEKKEAYEKAFEELNSISDQSESLENYNNISEKLRKLAQARYDIEGKDLGLNTIKVVPSVDDKAKEIENEIRILKSYINDKGNINKIFSKPGFKDDALKKSYNEAFTKALNVVLGKEKLKDLKEYQDLSAQLKKLTDEIKSKKISEVKPTDTTKIDKLKAAIEKVREFRRTATYESKSKENKDLKDKLEKALIEAEELEDKYKGNPTSVKDEDIDRAIKALEAALDDFYGFNNKDAARKALETLLVKTHGIKIDQIYDTSDQKEAKDAYIKAKDQAAKLVKNKDASVEDMAKAYKDLDDALNKLAEFLNKRLKDLVDDHPKFSESEKYKKVDADVTKDDVILNYLTVLADAKKELDKAAPDANALNNLYKKLKNARAEINGEMTSQARKLADAIIDGRALMETKEYKKLKAGLTGERKKAAEFYSRYLAVAEELQKAGKLDSQDAKDILDLINHARDFIEGKITEEKYLSNYYYHTLKALKTYKNGEEYKKLPQALRDKLDKALELYETSSDEKAVFSALDAVWREKEIQAIIKKMELERNPNVTRDKLLEDLNNLIAEDKKLKEGGFKYQKAQKVLRDAYDQALKEATDFIQNNDKPTEEQVRAVYNKLLNAKNALDGDKFDKLIHDLAARFKKEQMKIGNPADRKAIADKINSLSGENMTMDDALRVEKELNDLINPKFAATQTLVPQGQVPTTTRPVSTVTNPGSIVKTGINGIAKVAVVLVAALGIFIITSNKGDKK